MTGPRPVLTAAADAAVRAFCVAAAAHSRESLREVVREGADGTPTMRVDVLVEDAVIDSAAALGVNVLSEERGWVDAGSVLTLITDPVDGPANAAAGVPLACFSAALAVDGVLTHALTSWLHTDERWWASAGTPAHGTSGCRSVGGAAVSLLRPHPGNEDAWLRVARAQDGSGCWAAARWTRSWSPPVPATLSWTPAATRTA